jgi:hypothetical protein
MLFYCCNNMTPVFGSFRLLCRCYKDESHLVTNPTGYNAPRTNHSRNHHLQPLPHCPKTGGRVTATDFARALLRSNHGPGPTVTVGQTIYITSQPLSIKCSTQLVGGFGGRGRGTVVHCVSFSIHVFIYSLHVLRMLCIQQTCVDESATYFWFVH